MVSPLASQCQFQPDIYLFGGGVRMKMSWGRNYWSVGPSTLVPGTYKKSAPVRGTERGILTGKTAALPEHHIHGAFFLSSVSSLASTRQVGLGAYRAQRAAALSSNLQTSLLKLCSSC